MIIAKNEETLDDYSVKVKFIDEYLEKLKKWVRKGKYQCTVLPDDYG